MPYVKAPKGHSEFGGGAGLIDPMVRKDRALSAQEELIEIYATNPAAADSGTGAEFARLGPDNNPETADLARRPGADTETAWSEEDDAE